MLLLLLLLLLLAARWLWLTLPARARPIHPPSSIILMTIHDEISHDGTPADSPSHRHSRTVRTAVAGFRRGCWRLLSISLLHASPPPGDQVSNRKATTNRLPFPRARALRLGLLCSALDGSLSAPHPTVDNLRSSSSSSSSTLASNFAHQTPGMLHGKRGRATKKAPKIPKHGNQRPRHLVSIANPGDRRAGCGFSFHFPALFPPLHLSLPVPRMLHSTQRSGSGTVAQNGCIKFLDYLAAAPPSCVARSPAQPPGLARHGVPNCRERAAHLQ